MKSLILTIASPLIVSACLIGCSKEPAPAHVQERKVATINLREIFMNNPDRLNLQNQLRDIQVKAMADIDKGNAAIKTLTTQLAAAPAAQKPGISRLIQSERFKLQATQTNAQEQMHQVLGSAHAPNIASMKAIVAAYAKSHGISEVLDSSSPAVVYFEDAQDITADIKPLVANAKPFSPPSASTAPVQPVPMATLAPLPNATATAIATPVKVSK